MTISKRVVLSQLEVQPDGTIQVRLDKQVVEDDNVLSREYHRTVLPPGIEVDQQMALVNAHLEQMGWPPVETEALSRIKRIVGVEHTSGVKRAYQERLEAERKALADEEERQAALLVEQQAASHAGTPSTP
jgi:hypothetical protein